MTTLYKSINVLKIKDIYELKVAKFANFSNQKRLPKNFNKFFKSTNQFHRYQKKLVTNKNSFLERVTMQQTKSFHFFNGVKQWRAVRACKSCVANKLLSDKI